ncbi:hypothetical protein [Sphingomonas sp. KR3-1]|uniref:hypothetical protein n=1 Tax=Sphingomonas sp. KR3-1 TaxID=3156611 RepID=UPI0032B48AB5
MKNPRGERHAGHPAVDAQLLDDFAAAERPATMLGGALRRRGATGRAKADGLHRRVYAK